MLTTLREGIKDLEASHSLSAATWLFRCPSLGARLICGFNWTFNLQINFLQRSSKGSTAPATNLIYQHSNHILSHPMCRTRQTSDTQPKPKPTPPMLTYTPPDKGKLHQYPQGYHGVRTTGAVVFKVTGKDPLTISSLEAAEFQ
jgi:hypothetical protein